MSLKTSGHVIIEMYSVCEHKTMWGNVHKTLLVATKVLKVFNSRIPPCARNEYLSLII